MKYSYSSLLGLLVVAPVLWKLAAPLIVRHGVDLLARQFPQSGDLVMVVQGSLLTLRSPAKVPLKVHLVGLAPTNLHWKSEATGVLGMLVHDQPVVVQCVAQCQLGKTEEALVRLTNGTLLQTILLTDGLGKIVPKALPLLPTSVAIALRSAQRSAQQQHRNIWGQDS
ncbi:MAG TPA: hypothetical protein V6C88_01940 [Chroococcidiopsis sp.]